MKRWLTAVIFCFLFAAAAKAFDVEMDIRPGALRVGERATITITVYGANNPPQPAFTKISGLAITSTGVQRNFSFGNGSAVRMTRFSYQVAPEKAGSYKIGPFNYTIGKETKRLKAVELKVLPSGAPPPPEAEPDITAYLFAKAEASSTNVYSQQIFDLTLSVYYRNLSLANEINLINLPESGLSFDQFEEIPTLREQVDGHTYTVRRFRTKARALTTGDFRIQPTLRTHLIIPRENTRRNRFDLDPFLNNSLFRRQETRPYDVVTKAVTIKVLPTPTKGKPKSFAGAVGQFNFQAKVGPTEITAGDPVTVTMEIGGVGNMDTIRPPQFSIDKRFRAYETKLTKNELNASETGGRKVWEQVLIPKTAEVKQLDALEFSFFDVKARTYRTIRRGPFPLKVSPAPQGQSRMVSTKTVDPATPSLTILGDDLLYLKPLPTQWYSKDHAPWYRNTSVWVFQTLAPLLAVVGVLLGRRRSALVQDQAFARRVQAPKKARAGLKAAQEAMDASEPTAFFEAVWQTLCDYFGNRFNLQAGEISAARICDGLQPLGADEALQADIRDLVQRVETQRYTGQTSASPEELHNVYVQLERTVKDSEKLR